MMDFDNILDIASQNQDHGSVKQKRYSLQAGPPKKDPRSKGVNPAAVQALLKKQNHESKKKEIQMKKRKEELMAKRVELKSDRKARAMASRTKDNFRGYNGIPVVDVPKKRRSKHEMEEDASLQGDIFRNHSVDPEDDEDNYEYEQTDSEPEQEPEPVRPRKTIRLSESGSSGNGGKPCTKINSGPPKSAPPTMNFAELLKLAEKKQFQPVELKPKPVKKEERLRTAEEIRELEMERKAKRLGKERDTERERDGKSKSSPSLIRKDTSERGQKNCKPQKNSSDKPNLLTGSEKKSQQIPVSSRSHSSSSKPTVGDRDRERPKTSYSDGDRSKTSVSRSFGSINSKVAVKATSSQVSAKQVGPMPSSSHKSTPRDLNFRKKISSLHPERASGIPGTRPPGTAGQKPQHGSPQQTRPGQGSSLKRGHTVSDHKPGKGEPQRPGVNSAVKSSGNPVMRTSSGGPAKAGSQLQARPGGTLKATAGGIPQARPGGRGIPSHSGGSESRPPGTGRGQPGSGGLVPRQSTGSIGSGPGRPKCTVVSETISSKNLGGPRMGIPPRTGMPQRPVMAPRPGMPPRPIMNRGPMLPPITSTYKTQYEDEEEDFDSEMDDFIDDGGDEQAEVSKHIKEIFGYDRTKYRDESDYALKFMESSWKDMQKEEARSLKMAVLEDLEEEKKEEEERKRDAKRKKKN